jgi:hypothetical protein
VSGRPYASADSAGAAHGHTSGSLTARTGAWLGQRHSLPVEVATVLGLYAAYETTRGLVVGHRSTAIHHAADVAVLERHLHVFVEARVQHAASSLPGLVGLLGLAYLTLHLSVTSGYLLWLHQRRPEAFPAVRTTLLIASALSVVGFLLYPTAPPRDAGLGIADTISGGHVNLNKGIIASLYNPYAAIPSMHAGYALVIGVSLVREGRRRVLQVIGALYPLLVVFVIVATGNHFLFDAVTGMATVGVAAVIGHLLVRRGAELESEPAVAGPARRVHEQFPARALRLTGAMIAVMLPLLLLAMIVAS